MSKFAARRSSEIPPEWQGDNMGLGKTPPLESPEYNPFQKELMRRRRMTGKSPGKTPWVIVYDGTSQHGKPPYTLECLRCGAVLSPRLPITGEGIRLDDFVTMMRGFGRDHAKCTLNAGDMGGTATARPEK